eukprot:scaffold232997_cov33-Tisochrysis_lutea.AAC.4
MSERSASVGGAKLEDSNAVSLHSTRLGSRSEARPSANENPENACRQARAHAIRHGWPRRMGRWNGPQAIPMACTPPAQPSMTRGRRVHRDRGPALLRHYPQCPPRSAGYRRACPSTSV